MEKFQAHGWKSAKEVFWPLWIGNLYKIGYVRMNQSYLPQDIGASDTLMKNRPMLCRSPVLKVQKIYLLISGNICHHFNVARRQSETI